MSFKDYNVGISYKSVGDKTMIDYKTYIKIIRNKLEGE